jgi:hypothetical protein
VNSATRRSVGTTGRDTHVATVEIGLDGRHEALHLMAALTPFHSFVVQHDRAHWVVHARVPGCHDETLDDLLARIERWESDTGVNDFTCVVGGNEERS